MKTTAHDHDLTSSCREGIRVDASTHMVTGPEGSAHLTPREFDLMECLQANSGKPVSRTALLQDAWGWEYAEDLKTKTVEMHVGRLRQKISKTGANPLMIETIRGIGYRLNASA